MPERVKRLIPGGVCRKGHRLRPSNIKWRKGRLDNRYVECLTCVRDKNNAWKKSAKGRVAVKRRLPILKGARLSARIIEFETEDGLAKDYWTSGEWAKYGKNPAAPHNYLRTKAGDELEEFLKATDAERTKCFGCDEWTDYDDPRYPEEATGNPMPTTEEAQALCADCPFMVGCERWATAEKPEWGVYAGRVWLGGKPVETEEE